MKNPSDFKVGEVYSMAVASRSHVKEPYEVTIKCVGKDYIITEVPGMHSLRISKDNNWNYHIPRMKLVSPKKSFYRRILNFFSRLS